MNNDTTRICTICHSEKLLDAFMKRGDKFRNQCKECHNAKVLLYVKANPEKRKESKHNSYLKHKDSAAEYARNYYVENKDVILERGKNWDKANPEKKAEKYNRRRARLSACKTYEIRESFLINLKNSPCIGCGSRIKITQDHIVPLARGGNHSEGNLQPLCLSCNSGKQDKLMSEWKYKKGPR